MSRMRWASLCIVAVLLSMLLSAVNAGPPWQDPRYTRFRPFDEGFATSTIDSFGNDYADRLRRVLHGHFGLHDSTVTMLESRPLSPNQLVQDIRRDRNPRRFLYLGPVIPNAPQYPTMVVATPIAASDSERGARTFALLSVQRHSRTPPPTDRPHLFIHGYAEVKHANDIEERFRRTAPSGLASPEVGQVFSVEEMFWKLSHAYQEVLAGLKKP
ncbi:uncharacterized protein UTRI_06242 [Ustilago trichophora]|uniref:Uncharacterized protein n=1 Tax=Ustilago trichophora TaxID=86804 RepID=A0A5C3EF61_9BASI|nr:uncharacterized protein UTRI_06242 [Ustilago trichophora]